MAICCCQSHLARHCNGELMFGGVANSGGCRGGVRDNKGALATWEEGCHKAERKSLGPGRRLFAMLIYYQMCQRVLFFSIFSRCVIRKLSVFLSVQGKALPCYFQAVGAVLHYIQGV